MEDVVLHGCSDRIEVASSSIDAFGQSYWVNRGGLFGLNKARSQQILEALIRQRGGHQLPPSGREPLRWLCRRSLCGWRNQGGNRSYCRSCPD